MINPLSHGSLPRHTRPVLLLAACVVLGARCAAQASGSHHRSDLKCPEITKKKWVAIGSATLATEVASTLGRIGYRASAAVVRGAILADKNWEPRRFIARVELGLDKQFESDLSHDTNCIVVWEALSIACDGHRPPEEPEGAPSLPAELGINSGAVSVEGGAEGSLHHMVLAIGIAVLPVLVLAWRWSLSWRHQGEIGRDVAVVREDISSVAVRLSYVTEGIIRDLANMEPTIAETWLRERRFDTTRLPPATQSPPHHWWKVLLEHAAKDGGLFCDLLETYERLLDAESRVKGLEFIGRWRNHQERRSRSG